MTTTIIKDNGFCDETDPTKQVAFDVSGVTTGTTRTITVPNASGTMALQTTGSTSSTFTFNNTGGTSGSVSLYWVKVGGIVTLTLPNINATSGTASTTLTSNTALDASVSPYAAVWGVVQIRNNGGGLVDIGVFELSTGGVITIYRDATRVASWTNTSDSGTNRTATLSYSV